MTRTRLDRPPGYRARPRAWAAVILLAVSLCAGCRGGGSARRDAGSVVWAVGESTDVSPRDLLHLDQQGSGEVFLESAGLDWDGGEPGLRSMAAPPLPRLTPVSLVVRGEWPGSVGGDEEEAGRGLLGGLQQLRVRAEGRGLLVSGFHFDVVLPDRESVSSYARFLGGIRQGLDAPFFLSATVHPGWLEWSQTEELLEPVHFVVCFLYGEETGRSDRVDLWDLDAVERRARRLEEWGRDYLVGVRTLAFLQHRRGESLVDVSTRFSLPELLAEPGLKLELSFSFEGVHREIFELEVLRRMRWGDWRLQPGESLQVVRPTTFHLAEIHRRLRGLELDHFLGEAYYRLPLPEERHALSAANIVNARRPGPLPTPQLEIGVTTESVGNGAWVVRLELENPSVEATTVAMTGYNFVEIRAREGVFGPVELGQFKRMVLGRPTRDGLDETFRDATVLRLFYPILPSGSAVRSGRVVLRVVGEEPRLRTEARYMLPDGRTVEVEPRVWGPDGPEDAPQRGR